MTPLLLVSNYRPFPARWRAANGVSGESVRAASLGDFRRAARRPGAVFVVNCDPGLLLKLLLARMVLPGFRRPVVAVDTVLRRPKGLAAKLLHPFKSVLLARVDLHINFFRDVRGLSEVFGIPPERCAYVPFKVNLDPAEVAAAECTEDYALCFGRSLRDFDTFFAAMERVPHPGAIARVNPEELVRHGARFSRPLDRLPANVAQLPDDGTARAQLDMLRRAKLVVIPVIKESIVASGISTALNAMQLGKCVIGSEGPGMSDIFTDEVIAVPPEDPAALAAAIDRAWRDDDLRRRTAQAGRRAAAALGGEAELVQRLIDRIAEAYG